MRVYIKEPGEILREAEIENTLEELQRIVGGYIEAVTFIPFRVVMIVNEEGKIHDLKPNFKMHGGDVICGTAIFCGVDGDNFADITVSYKHMGMLYPQLIGEV